MKTCKGHITVVEVSDSITYRIGLSHTTLKVNYDNTVSPSSVTCKVYKQNGGAEEELDSSSVCLTYTLGDSDNEYTLRPSRVDKGFTLTPKYIDTQYDMYNIRLYLTKLLPGEFNETSPITSTTKQRLSEYYYSTTTLPFVADGQQDVYFQIWRGELEEPGDIRPWASTGESDAEHVGDYYIAVNMTYWEFKYDGNRYYWEAIEDKYLKNLLARSTEGTQGFNVDVEGAEGSFNFENFFANRNYKVGDLMYYCGKHWIAWIDKNAPNHEWSIDDWRSMDKVPLELEQAGLTVENNTVFLTADKLKLRNTFDETAFDMFVEGEGKPHLNTELLTIDGNVKVNGAGTFTGEINASQFEAQQSGGMIMRMNGNRFEFCNAAGVVKCYFALENDSVFLYFKNGDGWSKNDLSSTGNGWKLATTTSTEPYYTQVKYNYYRSNSDGKKWTQFDPNDSLLNQGFSKNDVQFYIYHCGTDTTNKHYFPDYDGRLVNYVNKNNGLEDFKTYLVNGFVTNSPFVMRSEDFGNSVIFYSVDDGVMIKRVRYEGRQLNDNLNDNLIPA